MLEDQPNYRTGKLCCIEIPAVDVAAEADQDVKDAEHA